MLQTLGIGYPAIIVKDMNESIAFYRRLGLRALYMEPNRDDDESIVAMLAAGDGSTFLQLVGPNGEGQDLPEGAMGTGSMQYLTFYVSRDVMEGIFHETASAGVQSSEMIDRGYEKLVFIEDPQGILVVLIAWATDPPLDIPRPAILAKAAQIRDAAGDLYVEDAHVQQAIAELQAAR